MVSRWTIKDSSETQFFSLEPSNLQKDQLIFLSVKDSLFCAIKSKLGISELLAAQMGRMADFPYFIVKKCFDL